MVRRNPSCAMCPTERRARSSSNRRASSSDVQLSSRVVLFCLYPHSGCREASFGQGRGIRLADQNVVRLATIKFGPSSGPSTCKRCDARLPVHDARMRSSALPLPPLCDAALCSFAPRSRTLQVLHRSAPPSHILMPFDAPYCSLQSDDALCVCVRSLTQ